VQTSRCELDHQAFLIERFQKARPDPDVNLYRRTNNLAYQIIPFITR